MSSYSMPPDLRFGDIITGKLENSKSLRYIGTRIV
jgi:hypothetical protein